jgi:hypothetical protein
LDKTLLLPLPFVDQLYLLLQSMDLKQMVFSMVHYQMRIEDDFLTQQLLMLLYLAVVIIFGYYLSMGLYYSIF